jgi:hypothetical protein
MNHMCPRITGTCGGDYKKWLYIYHMTRVTCIPLSGSSGFPRPRKPQSCGFPGQENHSLVGFPGQENHSLVGFPAKKTMSVIFPLKKHTSAVFCLSHANIKSNLRNCFISSNRVNLQIEIVNQGLKLVSQGLELEKNIITMSFPSHRNFETQPSQIRYYARGL